MGNHAAAASLVSPCFRGEQAQAIFGPGARVLWPLITSYEQTTSAVAPEPVLAGRRADGHRQDFPFAAPGRSVRPTVIEITRAPCRQEGRHRRAGPSASPQSLILDATVPADEVLNQPLTASHRWPELVGDKWPAERDTVELKLARKRRLLRRCCATLASTFSCADSSVIGLSSLDLRPNVIGRLDDLIQLQHHQQ